MYKRILTFSFFIFAFGNIYSQNKYIPNDDFLGVFWNVENFFDIYDNPDKNDDDFTYRGAKKWYKSRYNTKCANISKTILAIADKYEKLPSIIGLAEVENKKVLKDLLNNTALSKLNYDFVHYESDDFRGIDVALIYDTELFTLWDTKAHKVVLPKAKKTTRDILEVIGFSHELHKKIHIFVNHWPSKLGGEKKSLPNRMAAAKTLKKITDSLSKIDEHIIIIGDFNDTPNSKPIKYLCSNQESKLTNLSRELDAQGSLKYKGKWELIDQLIVSSHLSKDYVISIFDAPFLLEPDKTYLGYKPNRTYFGPMYHGGISDHLPLVFIFK